jgi:hypothetical protein
MFARDTIAINMQIKPLLTIDVSSKTVLTLLVGATSTRPAARVFETLMMSLTRCPPVKRILDGLGITPLKCSVTVMRGDSKVDHTLETREGIGGGVDISNAIFFIIRW